ncbi:importin [Salix suchowensis]|nr:importin [Salix suchowensis]
MGLLANFSYSFSIETITLGDKRIGIKTSVLEEKAAACNTLCCYADELKEGFFPWIYQEPEVEICVSMLDSLTECIQSLKKVNARALDMHYCGSCLTTIKSGLLAVAPFLLEACNEETQMFVSGGHVTVLSGKQLVSCPSSCCIGE